jgi:hypothetical protein
MAKLLRRWWIETAAAIKKGSSAGALVVATATATLASHMGVLAHYCIGVKYVYFFYFHT